MVPESHYFRLVFVLVLLMVPVSAKSADIPEADRSITGAFQTRQLPSGSRRLWSELRKLVFETDRSGRPLYPTLFDLWRTAEGSGLKVLVDLVTDPEKSSNIGGSFGHGSSIRKGE
jgi:hypothetical protein